jgi:hypothetical protein
LGDREPDTAAFSGDKCGFAVESTHGSSSPS